MSVKIDGSKVRFFATKKAAQNAARAIGWPVKCVTPVETRFQMGFALGMGVDVDPIGGVFLSRESFARLYIDRNGSDATPNF